jgi:aryl-alcohol dehydrogenase-like predicted oxidoreductase
MKFRKFGNTPWQVSEIGHGMWGLAGWKGSNESEYNKALDLSVEMGCNFFDSAWAYGNGLSEQVLASVIKRHPGKRLFAATKIPPKNLQWPARAGSKLEDVYPFDHIMEYTEKSLKNLQLETIDLQQFHVWDDSWADHDDWKNALQKLIKDGKVLNFGISVNRWEPNNCLKALATGHFRSVQVIYNIFDQSPEDELFPLCEKLNIGVIARVPFDEGSLTGMLSKDTVFPDGDWRGSYFVPQNLNPTVERVELLKPILPSDMSLPEMALRFILHNKNVSTIIPGMRSVKNVKVNMSASDGKRLEESLIQKLKTHRWDRMPTKWSQ